jgi:hypothetical protein
LTKDGLGYISAGFLRELIWSPCLAAKKSRFLLEEKTRRKQKENKAGSTLRFL